jgi:hypothetical protein
MHCAQAQAGRGERYPDQGGFCHALHAHAMHAKQQMCLACMAQILGVKNRKGGVRVAGYSTPPSARGSATPMDLHPLAPPSPPRPRVGPPPPKVPRLRRRGRHPIALKPAATHRHPPRAPTGLLALSCWPSDPVRAKPSLQIRHCQRAVQPGSGPQNIVDPAPPPKTPSLPHKISPPQGWGILWGPRAFFGVGGHFPTLTSGSRAEVLTGDMTASGPHGDARLGRAPPSAAPGARFCGATPPFCCVAHAQAVISIHASLRNSSISSASVTRRYTHCA